MASRRLEGPEALARLDVDLRRGGLHRGGAVPRVGSAVADPLLEVGGHVVGQLAARRHLQLRVADRLKEQALRGVAWNQSGAAVAAGAERVAGVEPQAAFDLVRLFGMALVAVLDQHRADLLLEEVDLLARRFGSVGRGGQKQPQSEGEQHRAVMAKVGHSSSNPPGRGSGRRVRRLMGKGYTTTPPA